jgi:hypothetical protein
MASSLRGQVGASNAHPGFVYVGQMRRASLATAVVLGSTFLGMVISCSSDEKSQDQTGGRGGSSGSSGASAGRSGGGGKIGSGGSEAGGTANQNQAGEGGDLASAGVTNGGGHEGGASDGGASQGGASQGGAGGSNETAMCSDFKQPQPQGTPVSIRLYNATNNPIYMGFPDDTCGYFFGARVSDADAKPLKAFREDCERTCGELQDVDCKCTPFCSHTVTLVAPGKYYEAAWTGTIFEGVHMPAHCYSSASCATSSCWVEALPPAGALTIAGDAYTQPICAGGPCNSCTPGGTGTCTVPSATKVGGTKLTGSASWTGQNKLQIDLN